MGVGLVTSIAVTAALPECRATMHLLAMMLTHNYMQVHLSVCSYSLAHIFIHCYLYNVFA